MDDMTWVIQSAMYSANISIPRKVRRFVRFRKYKGIDRGLILEYMRHAGLLSGTPNEVLRALHIILKDQDIGGKIGMCMIDGTMGGH